jgi:hypothetical protein
MEALVYILLIGTLIVIFFAVFFREAPQFLKKTILYGFFFNLMFFERITQIFEAGPKLYRQNMW